jgi:hypothetical protein
MRMIDFLHLIDPSLNPQRAKIHLATPYGEKNPLDLYLAGGFEEYQRHQNQRNFGRQYVISLIALPARDQWLYAGVYISKGAEEKVVPDGFYYDLEEQSAFSEFNGRLIVGFERPGRQSYLNAENWVDRMRVAEILPRRMSIGEFPGFRKVNLTRAELGLIVNQGLESWRSALSSVAGVYLISDTRGGKLYVGSACGEGGIWQRWCEYSRNGHGGNVELRMALQDDTQRAEGFRYSVLEIADIHASDNDILQRESHWKEILLTRDHGLNSN